MASYLLEENFPKSAKEVWPVTMLQKRKAMNLIKRKPPPNACLFLVMSLKRVTTCSNAKMLNYEAMKAIMGPQHKATALESRAAVWRDRARNIPLLHAVVSILNKRE